MLDLQVIDLDPDDDIISIRDRLDWSDEPRVALVLPTGDRLSLRRLDLVLLRRYADENGREVALVTTDSDLTRAAREVGLAVFPSVETAERRRSRRAWWQARNTPAPGLPNPPPTPIHAALPAPTKPAGRVWLARYAIVFGGLLALTLLGVAAVYFLPRATVTLRPSLQSVRVTQTVIADPALDGVEDGVLDAVDYERAAVPARRLTVIVEGQETTAATGVAEIPDGTAQGTVLFTNLTDEPVDVPAGTEVSGESTAVYETVSETAVAGFEGATAAAAVRAIAPGPAGNADAGTIDQIGGVLDVRLAVANALPIVGGSARQVAIVAEADADRLRAQLMQALQTEAVNALEAGLRAGERLAADSVTVVEVVEERFSRAPGDQALQLTLTMRADVAGTAVDPARANGLVYAALVAAAPDGYALAANSLALEPARLLDADDDGRVRFAVVGRAEAVAQLALEGLMTAVAGQPPQVAAAYLYEHLPLRALPVIQVQPPLFDRMPYLPARVRVRLVVPGN